MAFTVYSWGYGDSMVNVLQGVAMLFGHDGSFYGIAKVAALFGFIATLLAYFSARGAADPLRIVKFYVVFIGVVSVFFGMTANVQVHDKALNRTYVVQRVPYPVAYVLSFMTQVEDAIARQVDSAFGIGVDRCGSQNMGIFACSQIMAQSTDMRVVDPYLYLNLTNFFQDCVFTNILDGSLDAHQLETSNNLYGLIFSNLHPARFTVLYGQGQCTYPCSAPCGGGCSMSCVDAGAYLRSTLSQWVNTQGLNALSAAVGQTVLADLLNTVPSNVMRVSQTGTGFLMQSVLMNQFKETYSSWAASQGVGLTEQGLFTKGQIEKATANRYLPLINGILHVLFASLIPVLVIFMLTPLMQGALMLAFTFVLWMIVWRFAEAVVNGFFYSKLLGNFYNFAQQNGWDYNVLNAPVISALLVDHISLGGSLYWLVPTVSFMIASLGGYSFHSFATGLGGVVQGTAQSSAGDVARGSFNAGQVNYRNVSAGTTSLGNFSGWDIRGFNTSFLQEQKGNIISQGGRVEGKGLSVDNALRLSAIHGDDFTRNVIAAMSAIAGTGASGNMVINPQGRLEQAEMVSGDGGFRVVYDGRGNLKVMKGGVEHGNIMLNDKGEIDGPGRLMNLGGISASDVEGMAEELRETAGIYRQVAEGIRDFDSIRKDASRFQAFKEALGKLLQKDFNTFREVINALGKDKTFENAIKELIGKKRADEFSTTDSKEFKVGLKTGMPWKILEVVPGPEGSFYVSYKDQSNRIHTTYLTAEEVKSAAEKVSDSLKTGIGRRGGTTRSKTEGENYEKGVNESESFESGKMADVSKMLLKKADNALTFANNKSVQMVDNPLNDYYQQKYEEGLKLFNGDKAKAIRYAHEETEKLTNDKNALSSYIRQYAANQGLKDLSGQKPELLEVPNQVPPEEEIKEERENIQGRVKEEQRKATGEIKKGEEGIKRFNVPNVKLPKIEVPKLNLDFYKNGKVPPEYDKYLKWLEERKKEQPKAYQRPFEAPKGDPNTPPLINDRFDLKR